MISNATANFSDIIIIGERIENEIKHGRLVEASTEYGGLKKGTKSKKKEDEIHTIDFPNLENHKSIFWSSFLHIYKQCFSYPLYQLCIRSLFLWNPKTC